MKSIIIMFAGLAIGAYALHVRSETTWDESKLYWIIAGVVILIGAVINHWEHTRRE
jgi:hypothetical protein